MEQTTLYTENAPAPKDDIKDKVLVVDEKVQSLTADARRAQYEADTLSLARDVAQIGHLYGEVSRTEHALRTERITHLRNQNCIGASLVADFMANNMAIHGGNCKDQMSLAERARCFKNMI